MIAAEALSKRYGAKAVVDRVSFELRPGEVTGLIGRAGAGKSILLRMVVGLVRPSTGSATVLGQPYARLERAPAQVGVALGAMADPGDTVAGHLRFRARLAGASAARVSDTLERIGLSAEADRRVGELGFGSRQRLELGGALVGDPEVVVIDEPTDGLDVDGREWLHGLLRELAASRRTVLVASRDIPALGPALDAVLVMEAGRLVGQSSAEELLEHDGPGVLVQSPGAELLAERLHRAGVAVEQIAPDTLRAIGVEPATLGETVRATGVPVHQLAEEKPDLERAYLEFTRAADGNGAAAADENGDGDGDTVADARFAELARRLEAELAGAAGDAAQHVVAVVAPGPAQGRSTIAFLVADVLARHAGAKPLLVGLSAGPVGGHATAALESASPLTVEDVLRDLPGFDELAQLEPYCSFAPSGVALLAGPARSETLADVTPREVEELCAFAGRFHDVLVLDLGAVNPAALRATIAGAACVLLVAAQDATEALAASPIPDLVAELQSDPPIVVVNRTEAETAALAATVAAGDGHVAMPFDRQLVRLLDAGEFDPDSLDPAMRAAVLALGAAVARRLARC